MKKLFVLAAVATAMIACAHNPDPVKDALVTYLQEVSGETGKVKIYTLEKVDSTTFGQEIDRKIKLFELKISQNTNFYNTYVKEGKRKNAMIKEAAITKDRNRLEWLELLKENMSDRLDEVAYYDYRFSGKGNFETFISEYKDHYFAMTPQLEILGLSPDQNTVHKNTSKVLPGYLDFLHDDSAVKDIDR